MKAKEFEMNVKNPFKVEYMEKVRSEGYNLALGIGWKEDNYSLEVRLQPLGGSLDPIPQDLFDKIKNEILPEQYKGAAVNVVYVGIIRPR